MARPQSLQGKIRLIYDPTFDDVKKEVFSHWILEALVEKREPFVQVLEIEKYFLDRLGFEMSQSERTRMLFEESLRAVVSKGWAEVKSVPVGDNKEYAYLCLPAGRQRLEEIEVQRQQLIDSCYKEFVCLVYAQYASMEHRESAQAGKQKEAKIEQEEETALLEEAMEFMKSHLGHQDALRTGFRQMIDKISQEVADNMILIPLMPTAREGHQGGSLNTANLVNLFDLGSLSDAHKQIQFRRAIANVCGRLQEMRLESLPSIEYWFWTRAYERLFERIWPDEDLQDLLSRHLECIYVYLDTNALIAALSKADPLYRRAQQILTFLYHNNVNVFWLPITERELQGHLQLTRDVVRMLESHSEKEKYEILNLTNPPSFVRTYFSSAWRSWEQFEKEILHRYEQMKTRSALEKIDVWVNGQTDFSTHVSKYYTMFENALQETARQRHPALLRHDAYVLATIQALRENPPTTLVQPECRQALEEERVALGEIFWLVSFDRVLINLSSEKNENTARAQFPITLLYETILLFLDPYFVSKALKDRRATPKIDARLPLRDQASLQEAVNRARAQFTSVPSVAQYIDGFNWGMIKKYRDSVEVE
jgi:hypothetical protein